MYAFLAKKHAKRDADALSPKFEIWVTYHPDSIISYLNMRKQRKE